MLRPVFRQQDYPSTNVRLLAGFETNLLTSAQEGALASECIAHWEDLSSACRCC